MNRTIKFRAWDGLRMTTSGIMFNTSTGCVEVPTELTGREGTLKTPYRLMQFTGLLDKNGREIYEGDVVEYMCASGRDKIIAVVSFQHLTSCFVMRWSEGKVSRFVNFSADTGGEDFVMQSSISVIGNIYENPELI